MTTGKFTVTIHMVLSLDGIIAKKDNSVSWFETSDNYEKGVEVTAQYAAEFVKKIRLLRNGFTDIRARPGAFKILRLGLRRHADDRSNPQRFSR